MELYSTYRLKFFKVCSVSSEFPKVWILQWNKKQIYESHMGEIKRHLFVIRIAKFRFRQLSLANKWIDEEDFLDQNYKFRYFNRYITHKHAQQIILIYSSYYLPFYYTYFHTHPFLPPLVQVINSCCLH